MSDSNSALILIGYQNDYFAGDGILRGVVEESVGANDVLAKTRRLLEVTTPTDMVIIETPIIFTEDYSELVNPVGILKAIKDHGAFKAGTKGSETIPLIKDYGDRIMTVPGKRGLNAFSNTDLHEILAARGFSCH